MRHDSAQKGLGSDQSIGNRVGCRIDRGSDCDTSEGVVQKMRGSIGEWSAEVIGNKGTI